MLEENIISPFVRFSRVRKETRKITSPRNYEDKTDS